MTPSYDQRDFPLEERKGKLRVVASPDGRDGSLTIHQDAEVFLTTLEVGDEVAYNFAPAGMRGSRSCEGESRWNRSISPPGTGWR